MSYKVPDLSLGKLTVCSDWADVKSHFRLRSQVDGKLLETLLLIETLGLPHPPYVYDRHAGWMVGGEAAINTLYAKPDHVKFWIYARELQSSYSRIIEEHASALNLRDASIRWKSNIQRCYPELLIK